MTTDMIKSARPRCWNRPQAPAGQWYGIGWKRGKFVLRWYSNPFEDICGTWRGTGIGPTPATARYPQAHGWDCSGCRLLPVEYL